MTSQTLIKYHSPPNLPSSRITKNIWTHLPPGRDVIIKSLRITGSYTKIKDFQPNSSIHPPGPNSLVEELKNAFIYSVLVTIFSVLVTFGSDSFPCKLFAFL